MTLIKKIINFHNHNSNADYESTFVINDYNGIMIKLNKLREIIDNLSKLRKKNQAQEREELTDHLYRTLYYIKGDYKNYLFDLYDLQNFLKLNLDIKLKKKIQNQIDVALKTKSEIRKEFETIYNNFTNTAKTMKDCLPLKQIQTKMRNCFYFNNINLDNELKNYTSNKQYYDSVEMRVRHILH